MSSYVLAFLSPAPLSRDSDCDVSSGSFSAPSPRERFMNKPGLGIDVSESSDYFADNETTLGVEGDGNEERRRGLQHCNS
ncbi:hypothetical protein E4T38_05194 [Aureobasidium subglaciale]|nr:hypothetical protein E4T38_05194 [Aureobasidium subglaciale]KAI5220378.1 hypothetical protein E4T40_05958 [Aureobasidium subglaciale]KAI5222947.1 hypothetical protein E4T41_06384 [Aureobasidium subglaciale]KAI5260104.1 hypothetical protein E4T46_06266 [Aureobasidium subglaciale]